MRKRTNRAAICSSDNYAASKRNHVRMLREKHNSFCLMSVSGEISISSQYKTIKVFGKDMRISIEDYNSHCKSLGL